MSTATATSPKQTIRQLAATDNVEARYCGASRTMYVGGVDAKVKSFIRKMNLKGKGAFPFAIKQG